MATATTDALAELRLRQLTSAALPVGAFAYSQGLESAVEAGWVGHADRAEAWIGGQLRHTVATLEIPVLQRLVAAFSMGDQAAALRWSGRLLAMRDTAELRAQERALACAWAALLSDLGVPAAADWADCPQRTALALYALAVAHFGIDIEPAARAWVWAWLEAQVSAAVRAVPLGHAAAQRTLHALAPVIPAAVTRGLALPDADIAGAAPALSIASCWHETQYSRLFRS
ncbi:urease accessory UreF family protein [Immundisolibacter sp.]|uniref:urease accessory protein UreF n=1 Tax=Immundisolibacter sp. TaxID=1934948 RepID=UPI00261DA518|nr:urease accessory UreF family protein [Immundisolibacter sp.]MDD3652499.1 urease accessory UreF family protein [Immundisolibacter sp.]